MVTLLVVNLAIMSHDDEKGNVHGGSHGGDPFCGQENNLAVMIQNGGQGSVHGGSHGGDW